MDIIGRIDDTLEAWEHGPDAARWTPNGGQAERKTRGPLVTASLGSTVFVGEMVASNIQGPTLAYPFADHSGWREVGTTTGTITLSEDPPPAPEWLHMATCAYCDRTSDEPTARVFFDQDVRREWVDAHQEETGHTIWSLTSIRRDAITYGR